MASLRRHSFWTRLVAVFLLGAFVAASMGVIPSPQRLFAWLGRDAAERYPCESCGCGCAGAEECWTHCCCHSEHERLVWALENGVLPPAIVRFSDAQWIAAANDLRPGSAHCGACVERIKRDLARGVVMHAAAARMAASSGGCCATNSEACCATDSAAAVSSPTRTCRGCPGLSAFSCKGIKQLLTVLLPPTPPAERLAFQLPEPADFPGIDPFADRPVSRAIDVPTPPPRA